MARKDLHVPETVGPGRDTGAHCRNGTRTRHSRCSKQPRTKAKTPLQSAGPWLQEQSTQSRSSIRRLHPRLPIGEEPQQLAERPVQQRVGEKGNDVGHHELQRAQGGVRHQPAEGTE